MGKPLKDYAAFRDFDREKHTLRATRKFDFGAVHMAEGETLTRAQMDALGDASLAGLVINAGVAEIITFEEAAKAAKARETADDKTSGKAPEKK